MTSTKTVCISGTDRGIGLALTHQLLIAGYTVFAGGIVPDNEWLKQPSGTVSRAAAHHYVGCGQ